MKNILFRTDSSSKIGIGHVMRSLVLAKQYPKDNIKFAVQNLPKNINRKIKDAGYAIETLKTNNIDECIQLIKKLKIDLIIIDHYDIKYKQEKKIKEQTGIQIFVLDDTYEKHYCDILLNHNIGANKLKYRGLVPENAELRCGENFALIREEFIIEKKKRKSLKNNKRILVSMGGTDAGHLNIKILEVLLNFKNIKVDIITTNANLNLDELKILCYEHRNFDLHIETNKMATLMNQASLIITTPSVTINEVYYMDIPFIAIKIAENQNEIYKFLHKKKYPTMDHFDPKVLNDIIMTVMDGLEHE